VAYAIKITRRAERDLRDIYEYIGAENSAAALEWYVGLKAAVLSLENSPHRCASTLEAPNLKHLLYGKKRVYRVIYRIVEDRKEVEILHLRHGARREFDPEMFRPDAIG